VVTAGLSLGPHPTADAYQGLLDRLADAIEGLPADAYTWGPGEVWHRGSRLDGSHGLTSSLEFFVDLGAVAYAVQSRTYSAAVTTLHRYQPDQDGLSQARMHAATDHLRQLLRGYLDPPTGARAAPRRATVEAVDAGWAAVVVEFDLIVPER
jgi:phage baseplate assembly protein W